MSEWRQHINPWAEKLSEVSLPDEAESWKGMELLLDREMRIGRRKQWRRWILLILLLLLLIGVCHCPGRPFLSGKSTGSFVAVPAGDKVKSGPSVVAPKRGGATAVAQGAGARPPERTTASEDTVQVTAARGRIRKMDSVSVGMARTKVGDKRTGGVERAAGAEDTTTNTASRTTTKPAAKTTAKTPAKTPPAPPEDSAKKEHQGGWMVGIGLNQFFTVGGQQASSWNSGGITGTLGDYIPVPMIRYYFNPKLYVQLEAQINTPQYTKKNLVAVKTPVDSLSPVSIVQSTVSINKLFYFNVPLSLHYTVFDKLDLGAGLQFSRLTNGIGDFSSNYQQNGVDSASKVLTKSFKGDSAYREIRTHEFRFLVDANYTWKHFILGIRYNQALSKFIHVEISPGQVTQARNSSLQLYLRYILWDGRKNKPLLPAK